MKVFEGGKMSLKECIITKEISCPEHYITGKKCCKCNIPDKDHKEVLGLIKSKQRQPIGKKFKNIVKCTKCGDVIESKYRDVKVSCKCGDITISGGMDKLKRSSSDYIEMSGTYDVYDF
jgi:hypothetical protein